MSIKDFSTEELKAELASRSRPAPRVAIDTSLLASKCSDYLDHVARGLPYDTQYIFEAAVETIYGPSVWEWVNEHEE